MLNIYDGVGQVQLENKVLNFNSQAQAYLDEVMCVASVKSEAEGPFG